MSAIDKTKTAIKIAAFYFLKLLSYLFITYLLPTQVLLL